MSIDGDLWDFPNESWRSKKFWKKLDPTDSERSKYDRYIFNVMVRNINGHYVKKYGNYRVGIVEIPTLVLAKKIVDGNFSIPEVNSPDKLKVFFKRKGDIPKHPLRNRWPVILGKDGVIEDGWHRFSQMLVDGHKITPCLFYV